MSGLPLSFEQFVELEQAPADSDDVLYTHKIPPSAAEYSELLNQGASAEDLRSGYLKRGLLLDSGFIFVNSIGNGEKALLAANDSLPFLNDDDTGRSRLLLTSQELDDVRTWQAQTSAGLGEFSSKSEVRETMFYFLLGAVAASGEHQENAGQLFLEAQRQILAEGQKDDLHSVARLFDRTVNQEDGDTIGAGAAMRFLMERCVAGIEVDFIAGIPVAAMPTRFNALRNSASPFIDSGFRFGTNYDVTLFPNDTNRTRRLNMVVVHLLSRGLNEIGSSTNGSHDQTYITEDEFVALDFNTNPELQAAREEAVDLVKERLVAISKE